MSSYLLALSIGDYASLKAVTKVDKVLVRVWTWNGMQNYVEKALQSAVDTLDYMSTYLNQPCSLGKLDLVALPQFIGRAEGAMENWGLILGDYNEFLWHPDYSDTDTLNRVMEVISHETTHQWFGDLISPAWWQYLFLNEGFASYLYIDVISNYYPQQQAYADSRWFYNSESAMTEEESFGGLLPTIPEPSLVGSGQEGMFSISVYSKAAAILKMLRDTVGNVTFQTALRQYFKENQYTTVTDETLWGYVTQAAANAGIPNWNYDGFLNISSFMRPYTYQVGVILSNL
uniref:Peptidase M1 membrane alanine aminopeptidase domain-containing protein n=1 Tax=Acrobeloides nanus TaxID=290746 RepID=A0A914ECM1_9BILA